MESPHAIILKPVVSEKSYRSMEENFYTFIVAPSANKIEIRKAVEQIFGVKVLKVNTLNRKGKRKRDRKSGEYSAKPRTKRAIVKLAENDRIELFDK